MTESSIENITAVLIQARKDAKLTQRELAQIIGVHQPTIANIESGKLETLKIKTVVDWLNACGLKLYHEVIKVTYNGTLPPAKSSQSRAVAV